MTHILDRMQNPQSTSDIAQSELVLAPSLSFLAPLIVDDLIRVGKRQDGGYAVSRAAIDQTDLLVSLGVNEDWSFEEDFRRLNPRVKVHAYDHTVSRAILAGRLQRAIIKMCLGKTPLSEVRRRLHLLRSYRTFFNGAATHFENRIHNRLDLPFDTTLNSAMARADSGRVFLKVDIEGSEYRVIEDIVRSADRIVGIVIEFHDTEPLRPVFETAVRHLQERFAIVHLHANNFVGVASDGLPEVLELTFIPKSRHGLGNRRSTLPVPLIDYPNNPAKPDYRLRFQL